MKIHDRSFIGLLIALIFVGCSNTSEKRTILAIPVYGQSLALGEEATRITNFDSLSERCHHQILTENLDEKFGYFSDTHFKQMMKKLLHDDHRSFELSVYGMAEVVTNHWASEGCDSLMICTFPGGQGASSIIDIGRNSKPYDKFLDEIKKAYQKARRKNWNFIVPAVCWMQGEDDIVWDKTRNYGKALKQFQMDLTRDVKAITKQTQNIIFICYQTNCLTLSKKFNANAFDCREALVPQAQMELVKNDKCFMASGPTYPYSFAREWVHIDATSQKRLGYLAGLSVIKLLHSQTNKGLTPSLFSISKDTILINFNVPYPPLVIDTLNVSKIDHYGFTVIDSTNTNILKKVIIQGRQVKLCCKKSPANCKARYAINGQREKSGYKYGPRGNLRDSQGNQFGATILGKTYPLHNWCFQFDVLVKEPKSVF